MTQEGKNLKNLGSNSTKYLFDEPNFKTLETFKNKYPKNKYTVEFETNEFTSLCPKTKQPDFANIHVSYSPDELCVETKSLKLYLFSYRNYGSFMETITNKILNDLVKVSKPNNMTVTCNFNLRGGIGLKTTSTYIKK